MKKTIKQLNNSDSQIAEKKVKNINVFFAAYGSFITGLFTVSEYFFNQFELFVLISLVCALVVLGITYYLAYSKKATKYNVFWTYVGACADAVGVLNPIMLAVSIMLSVAQTIEILCACIALSVLHLINYVFAFVKCCSKKTD